MLNSGQKIPTWDEIWSAFSVHHSVNWNWNSWNRKRKAVSHFHLFHRTKEKPTKKKLQVVEQRKVRWSISTRSRAVTSTWWAENLLTHAEE